MAHGGPGDGPRPDHGGRGDGGRGDGGRGDGGRDDGGRGDSEPKDAGLVDDFVRYLRAERSRSEHTIRAYASDVTNLGRH
ncbi:MAG TPA: site-specific integrase, partial [Lapillicoccus sp.]|nr:site-specific integrase [Lapillicoccus sp.]